MASLKLVGGLAFTSDPSSAAASSTELTPRLIAMRLCDPSVLMASGKGETWPLTVGFSISSAWPPPGFFISRSASLGDLQLGGDRLRDALEFTRCLKLLEKIAKGIESHALRLPEA